MRQTAATSTRNAIFQLKANRSFVVQFSSETEPEHARTRSSRNSVPLYIVADDRVSVAGLDHLLRDDPFDLVGYTTWRRNFGDWVVSARFTASLSPSHRRIPPGRRQEELYKLMPIDDGSLFQVLQFSVPHDPYHIIRLSRNEPQGDRRLKVDPRTLRGHFV